MTPTPLHFVHLPVPEQRGQLFMVRLEDASCHINPRLPLDPSRPRRHFIWRCRASVVLSVLIPLSFLLGLRWEYPPTREFYGQRYWSIISILPIVAAIECMLVTWWHYCSLRWMDRNQQW